MRASLKLQAAAIGLLAVTACSGASAPATVSSVESEKLGVYLASWIGLLPGDSVEGTDIPHALRDTKNGRRVWGASYLMTVDATRNAYAVVSRVSGGTDITTALGSALGTDSGASSSGLPTSPSVGSGAALPTTPSVGSGASLPTGPETSLGTLPPSPSVGAGATVSQSPSTGGSASSSDLQAAICTFVEGFFGYISNCSGGTIDVSSLLASQGGCTAIASAMTTELAGASVPASTVTALACIGNKLKTTACASVSETSNAFSASLSSCGITTPSG